MSKPYKESQEFNEMVASNKWHSGSELYANIRELVRLIADEEWRWSMNPECKYIDIRIDMRDGGHVLTNRSGNRISIEGIRWQYDKENP